MRTKGNEQKRGNRKGRRKIGRGEENEEERKEKRNTKEQKELLHTNHGFSPIDTKSIVIIRNINTRFVSFLIHNTRQYIPNIPSSLKAGRFCNILATHI